MRGKLPHSSLPSATKSHFQILSLKFRFRLTKTYSHILTLYDLPIFQQDTILIDVIASVEMPQLDNPKNSKFYAVQILYRSGHNLLNLA